MRFLPRIFGNQTKAASVAAIPQEPFVVGCQDDKTLHAAPDILKGLVYHATLQIRTPLSVLEHDGERHPGPPSVAPKYGSLADGHWAYELKSFDEIAGPNALKRKDGAGQPFSEIFKQKLLDKGFTEPEARKITSDYKPNQVASDIGPVTSGEYLPFLIAFRTIMEGSAGVPTKLKQCHCLRDMTPEFRAIWQRLGNTYEDFPRECFYMQFTAIPGLGRKLARRLFEAGLYDLDGIQQASDDMLRTIPGIGAKLLNSIRVRSDWSTKENLYCVRFGRVSSAKE